MIRIGGRLPLFTLFLRWELYVRIFRASKPIFLAFCAICGLTLVPSTQADSRLPIYAPPPGAWGGDQAPLGSTSINASGVAVGIISGTSDGAEAPGRWDGLGNSIEMDDLATQPFDSVPVAINSAGLSVGWAMRNDPTGNSQTSGILWDQSGHATILAQFSKPGGQNAIYQPSRITDDGTIFGSVQ